ncbi:hypothetical protein, partial [Aromatoleum toluolicum]|uniref:hypothetical protein n=1 Tax=Aromatoleum toluolicum TaxID=90060 RepID=UPI00402B9485
MMRSNMGHPSKCRSVAFAGADAHRGGKLSDPDDAVARLAGMGRCGHGLHNCGRIVVSAQDQQHQRIVPIRVPFVGNETVILTVAARVPPGGEDRETRQVRQCMECRFHGFEPLRANDCGDLFHRCASGSVVMARAGLAELGLDDEAVFRGIAFARPEP